MIKHPNIVSLKYFFENVVEVEYLTYRKSNVLIWFLNSTRQIYLDFIKIGINILTIFLFMSSKYLKVYQILIYQLFRGIAYLHFHGICHRDIKPENLMIDTPMNALKIGDFGRFLFKLFSAVKLVPGEPHISYICSRYYRAPELILGWKLYSYSIDIWSAGCILAELLQGDPIFIAPTSIDLFCEIAKILGTPTKVDLDEMNPAFSTFSFPILEKQDFAMVLSF